MEQVRFPPGFFLTIGPIVGFLIAINKVRITH